MRDESPRGVRVTPRHVPRSACSETLNSANAIRQRAHLRSAARTACFPWPPRGYQSGMSKITALRAPFILLRPFHRITWYLLLWTQRHTLALWFRSLSTELRRERPINVARVRRLAVTLFRVAADPRLSNAPELQHLTLTDDVVTAHTDEHWAKRPLLITVLTGVDHVNEVRFN